MRDITRISVYPALALAMALAGCGNSSSGGGSSATPDASTGGMGGAGGMAGAGGAGGMAMCNPGEEGCACMPGNTCNAGLTCAAEVCVPDMAPTMGLSVNGEGVKGCQVLLREGPTPVSRVGFVPGVSGQFVHRDGKLAIAFLSAVNADLADVGGVELKGGATATAGDLEIVNTTCVGSDGRTIAGATVTLD